MKKVTSLLLIVFMFSAISFSQEKSGHQYCSEKKRNGPNFSLVFDSPNTPKHSYNVLSYKLNLDIRSCFITPYPKNFNGSVIITFKADSVLSSIKLNAVNTSIVVNSVGLSGTSFTHSGDILTVTLNRTYNLGEVAQVQINYTHQNVSDGAFNVSGGMVFTDAEPEGARKWFPCWDKPSDKGLFDLTVKVPANAKLGSNGRLADSTLTGDSLYYHWVSRDPISTYLMVMSAKVGYNLDIVYWHKISNPSDSVPMRFYYNAGENPTSIKNIIGPMTTYYSQKFGEMGFEKNGFATMNNLFTWGGMENQTLTSLCPNCWSANLVSHEYAHQWFGDMVTCGTWADIWLNEGFATYCEALWYENTGGYTSYKNDIIGDANGYLNNNPGWPMYNPSWIDNTPNVNTLFNEAITYNKGACVLHMLRYVLQDTNVFFNCLRGYATDTTNYRYKNTVTDDFSNTISQISGQDLTWFINQWVKYPDHPIYVNTYWFTPLGGGSYSINFRATQTQTTTPFHRMPITLKVSFASGADTVIRVMNDFTGQQWSWTSNRQPLTFAFDPDNDIVLKQASLLTGVAGESNNIPKQFALHQNYPNPFNPSTMISFDLPVNAFVTIKVYNTIGQLVQIPVNENRVAGNHLVELSAKNLPSGVYFYEINATDKASGKQFTATNKMVLVK
jgi:aminopeptidase N